MKLIQKFICTCLFLITGSSAMDNPRGLDPSQRPQNLTNDIQTDFDRISSNFQPWKFNGASTYFLLRIYTDEFAKVIIKSASLDQKDFYLLDIGAGKFNCGIGIADYLNKQKDIPDDITIHIVSVTGENYGGLKIEDSGRCKLYNIDAFKIEDLAESFKKLKLDKKLNLDFDGKFDLIVSQYTFLHLHDPVGTFVHAYNLLRPKTGLMLMEGFPVYFSPEENYDSFTYKVNMLFLLGATKAPFLVGEGRADRGINSFLLRRPDDRLLNLPLNYKGTLESQPANTYRKSVAYFSLSEDPRQFGMIDVGFQRNMFYGDKNLYEWVYTHYPFWQMITTSWGPLYQDDLNLRIEHEGTSD